MSKTKWTPGPWKFGWETNDKRWGIITNSKGDIIANVNTQTGPDLSPLCPIVMPCVANANLMIASPGMYKALEDLLNDTESRFDFMGDNYPCDAQLVACANARAALARARGEVSE